MSASSHEDAQDIQHEGNVGLDDEADTLSRRTTRGELADEHIGLSTTPPPSSTPWPPPPIEPNGSDDAAEMRTGPRKSLIEQTKPRRFSMSSRDQMMRRSEVK